MSDAVKWALLAAGIVVLIGLIVALPFMDGLNVKEFASLIGELVTIAGTAFKAARGIINNFLTPFGRTLLTGLLYYLFGKFFITISIKIGSWVYHFIFK